MSDLLITTTPILDKIEILQYLGPLTANVVLGVNFFSDFAASLTDVFGGNSETYQSKLDSLTNEVTKIIKVKAARIGANAIINYNIQFNEISGKGKQMFMVTASGTACKIIMPTQEEVREIGQIAYSQIRRQYIIDIYEERLHKQQYLVEKDWENILSLNLSELANDLTKEYFRLKNDKKVNYDLQMYINIYSSKFEEFLSRLDKSCYKEFIYQYINTNPELVVHLVEKNNLFDPQIVLNQFNKGNITIAISLLRSHKDYYTKEDLDIMQEIIKTLDSMPDLGSVHTVISGMFSKKEEQIYLCLNGHKNEKDRCFCKECGLDIKGFSKDQHDIINQFKRITKALESIIK